VSKYLDKVIKEMANYANMGMPDGEGAMGMGSVSNMGMRGAHKGKAVKAYKLNDILRYRNAAEEEEGFDDMEGMDDEGMGDEFGSDDDMGGDTQELQQFFTDNPEPSDEEIAMYAEEHDMDLQGMRSAVYALIQSLLPDSEEGMDDEGMDDEFGSDEATGDDMDFSVSGDTGERPAKNEFEERMYRNRYGKRSDRRR